ncbi:hypothetical protein FRX31_023994 [Thalictrum thalictroides]|uniref:DUF4283 domain-containing protein n=1 Tax=Thalictrum thalictroides TaxID=46969 RepID=A0A7J6VMU4_THATH|nr:hypothetical protein FRX31_023994 [Thalictrum thalictroides]
MDMVKVGPNHFVCKVYHQENMDRIETGQPWQILGCIVLIEPFSSPMDPDFIIFKRVPLRICFNCLLLEYLVIDTIRDITSDTGEVIKELPDRLLPRIANGFRGHDQFHCNATLPPPPQPEPLIGVNMMPPVHMWPHQIIREQAIILKSPLQHQEQNHPAGPIIRQHIDLQMGLQEDL